MVLAATGIIVGFIMAGKSWWLVRHPSRKVLDQMHATLQASGIKHEQTGDTIRITLTGTEALAQGWGPVSRVSFRVVDPKCRKERFLLEMLTKYLRFIGKKDANG